MVKAFSIFIIKWKLYQSIKLLGLTSSEFEKIKEIDREPNLLELGIFSAMWNEHCSYKSSRVWLSQLPTKNKM